MNYLSVCSGIEAASVAWCQLGWNAVGFSEIEPFPCSVLAHHYPDVPNFGDMTKFEEWPDVAIDLLCGGTPCQSFSVAGLRKGLADPRGNLMLTFGAIAARFRPEWLVWENVPGVLSSNGGRDFGSFLGLLGVLGYGFAYRVLDAQYFGLAQRRKRVFVVGCLGNWQRAAAVLFERHSLQGHPAPSREARAGTAGGAGVRAAISSGHGWWDESDVGATIRAQDSITKADTLAISTRDVAHCLNAGGMGRQDFETETETLIAHALRGEGFDASEDGTGRGTPLVPVAFDTTQITSAANYSSPKAGDPCHPLAAGAHAPAIAFQERGREGGRSLEVGGELAFALTAPNGGGRAQERNICQAMQVRRLTPLECERLQGFPDHYTAVAHRGKPAADGPRYKALGNSWAVPCVRWIGERIEMVSAVSSGAATATSRMETEAA